MREEEIFRKVVFLDTMTLHYIRHCLEYAKEEGLQFPKDEQAISELKSHFSNISEKHLREALQTGLETIVLLSRNDVQIEYSPISELEILNGIAEGKARINIAKDSIPHRMWSKFSEKEIRDRITAECLAAIKAHVDELGSMLEESGITVIRSDSRRTNEVIDLAKGIVGLIYMGEMDSIIYASAVAAGADYLVSADSYLRETVNLIYEANEQRYIEIKQQLKELISNILLIGQSDEIELPHAFTITHAGRVKDVSSFP